MSDAEFLLVITATFCVVPFACCAAVRWVFAKRACAWKARTRVWVLSCEERNVLAIVELSGSAISPVKDCSCWRENPHCGKSCVRRAEATEQVRLLAK